MAATSVIPVPTNDDTNSPQIRLTVSNSELLMVETFLQYAGVADSLASAATEAATEALKFQVDLAHAQARATEAEAALEEAVRTAPSPATSAAPPRNPNFEVLQTGRKKLYELKTFVKEMQEADRTGGPFMSLVEYGRRMDEIRELEATLAPFEYEATEIRNGLENAARKTEAENTITQAGVRAAQADISSSADVVMKASVAARSAATAAALSDVKASKSTKDANDFLATLPESFRKVSRERLRAMANLVNLTSWSGPVQNGWLVQVGVVRPVLSNSTQAAIIRGELSYGPQLTDENGLRTDDEGHQIADLTHPTLGIEIVLTLEQFGRDYLVVSRENHEPAYIHNDDVLPERQRKLSLSSLEPWHKSPVPTEVQLDQIGMVKLIPDDLHGWMLLGPKCGGTSKTTFVTVYLKDEITLRLAEQQAKRGVRLQHELCVWRIELVKWLAENLAWQTRDWEDKNVEPPKVTIDVIKEACRGTDQRPILWLEELDKMTANHNRIGLLNSLVNAVYERNGLVISTTNDTMEELEARLGGPTLRRLNGANDPDGEVEIWDLHPFGTKSRDGRKSYK